MAYTYGRATTVTENPTTAMVANFVVGKIDRMSLSATYLVKTLKSTSIERRGPLIAFHHQRDDCQLDS